MLKKTIILLLLPILAQIIIACCDCEKPIKKRYTNRSISVENLDNSGEKPIIPTSSSVDKNAYGIQVNFHRQLVARSEFPIPSLFQSAYATSCDCPYPLEIFAQDSVTSFSVYTANDFNSTHGANSDISEYFKVFRNNFFTTIDEYVTFQKESGSHIINPLYSHWTLHDESQLEAELILLLTTPPESGLGHRFRVEVAFSDGRITQMETKEIDLL